jgi:ethanolamine ammonia-lyase small subunit
MADESEEDTSKELAVENPTVIENPWRGLRQLTPARIALGRAGHSLPTRELLAFQLAHAQARDAVYSEYDPALLAQQLSDEGYQSLPVHSQATDRLTFLRRPDSGRRLSPESRQLLEEWATQNSSGYDAVFVLGDGLSAQAIHHHALAVLKLTVPVLQQDGWKIAPVVLASGSRVALGDEIGQILKAEQVAILIGERPGLSAADSLGIYLTYNPYVGRLESDRNCISNIRPEGLAYEEASATLLYLMQKARRLKFSGVKLKDERDLT